MTAIPPQQTFYDAIGGEPAFRRIVARFFAQVPHDQRGAMIAVLGGRPGAGTAKTAADARRLVAGDRRAPAGGRRSARLRARSPTSAMPEA